MKSIFDVITGAPIICTTAFLAMIGLAYALNRWMFRDRIAAQNDLLRTYRERDKDHRY